MPESIKRSLHVEERHAGRRVDQVAAELFPDFSRARLQQWIREGCLTLDHRRSRSAQRVAGGELMQLEAELKPDGEVLPEAIALDVIAADHHIIVVNKPAGLVVHPAAGNPDGTLQNALLHFDPDLATIPRAGIVHRLDKDTTGLMVVARSLKAHSALVASLQERRISRIYETVVNGQAPASGTVNAPVGRNPRDRQRMAVVKSGKPAVSHFSVLTRFRHFSRLEVKLESGRTHQIRVHMQHIGLPLVGDPLYGRKSGRQKDLAPEVLEAVRSFPRQALHARELRFRHPDSGEPQQFEAPLPADMAGLLEVLAGQDTLS